MPLNHTNTDNNSNKSIVYEKSENIAVIKLNNPSNYNCLSSDLISALNQSLIQAQSDDSIFAIVITGSQKGFSSGGNLKEFVNLPPLTPPNDPIKQWEFINLIDKPIIAAISGFAIGGGLEIALMCDWIIGSHTSSYSQPECKLGFIPGCGATIRLIARMGYSQAFNFIASTARVDAKIALSLGIIDEINDDPVGAAIDRIKDWQKALNNDLLLIMELKKTMKLPSNNSYYEQERTAFYKLASRDSAQQSIINFLEVKK